MSRTHLIEMARESLAHARAGTIEQTEAIHLEPARHYFDEERWRQEMDRIFKRVPLMLATTPEIPNPGDYKAMDAVDTPVLISRGQDGRVRAFVNMCRHRGSQIMPAGTGSAKRFTCPYHAWSYDQSGALVGVFSEKDFGTVDRSCYSLVELPAAERAGLIWVHLNPNANLGHRRLPFRLRRHPAALRFRQLALLRKPGCPRPQLEDRLRRLHGPLPPADPAQGTRSAPTCSTRPCTTPGAPTSGSAPRTRRWPTTTTSRTRASPT